MIWIGKGSFLVLCSISNFIQNFLQYILDNLNSRLDNLQQPQVASHGASGGMYFSCSLFMLSWKMRLQPKIFSKETHLYQKVLSNCMNVSKLDAISNIIEFSEILILNLSIVNPNLTKKWNIFFMQILDKLDRSMSKISDFGCKSSNFDL